MSYLWVTLGSALGGLLRYALTRLMLPLGSGFPYGTVIVNIIGCFVIGYFGTLTLHGSKYQVSDELRIFVMVGICGGFTTFSSFSLQTFDLLRSGAWVRALANVMLSVAFCLGAVAAGHWLAQSATQNSVTKAEAPENGVLDTAISQTAIAQTAEEEFTG